MNTLVSIDPGKSSGVAVIQFDSHSVYLSSAYQTSGGVSGFRSLLDTVQSEWGEADPIWISEKFSPRPGKGFSLGLDSTLPLVCEGVLIDRGILPEYMAGERHWRSPSMQYLVGGSTLSDKRKRQAKFLKDSGFYRTGKDFGTPDADDFRSATAHGLAYLARELKHKPTFQMISDWVEKNA